MTVHNALAQDTGQAPPHRAAPYPAREDGCLPERCSATLRRHLATIQAISDDVGRPFEEIAAVYQIELLRMAAHAAVVDYLPVLVEKHVRAFYKHRLHAR